MKKYEVDQRILLLRQYFAKRHDVIMAFVFGSHAAQRAHNSSDWDIAVYFEPQSKQVEWECQSREYPKEDEVWNECSDILKTDNIDLLVLNRAPASIAATAINGILLVVKDRNLWREFMLIITREAQDYRQFVNEYYAIRERSLSLDPHDQEGLKKEVTFIEEQITLYDYFSNFTEKEYANDIHKRNDVERWIENIVNASIDISKIILASQKRTIPNTYQEIMKHIVWTLDLDDELAKNLVQWTRLRNILAHEYLDIKWKRISHFIKNSHSYIEILIRAAKKYMEVKK